jgi:glycosyltransferase involved in cell wall biosynthesis
MSQRLSKMSKEMRRPKLLIIVHGMGVGGIERYVLRFIAAQGENFETKLLCKSGNAGELAHSKELDSVSVTAFRVSLLPSINWYHLWKFVAEHKFDCVLDFTGDFAAVSMLLCEMAGVERRFAFYRNERESFTPTVLKKLYARILRKVVRRCSSKVLSNSYSALDYFFGEEREPECFQVIYNGVSQEEFRRTLKGEEFREKVDIPIDAFVIGHVGRYIPQKNHATIFGVCNLLMQRNKDTYLIVIGKDTRVAVDEFPWTDAVKDRVISFEYMPNINDALNALDVFLFPSLFEGNPNALIEALLCETPCVVSDVPSIRECIPRKHMSHISLEPTDVDGYVRVINQHYERNYIPPVAELRDFASVKFDQAVNFATLTQTLQRASNER